MRSFLLANTLLPDTTAAPTASWPQAQMALSLPAGAEVWHRFAQLQEPRLLAYTGSLGDPLALDLTIADLATDWRLKIILMLPLDRPDSLSIAAAYSALISRSRGQLLGFIGSGSPSDPDVTAQLSAPYLGDQTTFSWSELLAVLPHKHG